MYAFARRPRWLVGHLLVALAVVAMVNLGFWQLRRLDERRSDNALVEQRMRATPARFDELAGRPVGDIEFRRAIVTGTFDPRHEVLVGFRTQRGLPGFHVVTPLIVGGGVNEEDGGGVVLVNRGFVPVELADRWPVADAAPPAGSVEVTGLVRKSARGRTPSAPTRAGVSRTPRTDEVDVDRITDVGGSTSALGGAYVELQRPAPAGFPEPLPPIDLGEGPHLSYAVQWFAFSTIAVVGWVVLLRRMARSGDAHRDPD